MFDPAEHWRPVVGHEMSYEVSDLGRVRSLDRAVANRWGGLQLIRGRVMAPHRHRSGHMAVGLRSNGQRRGRYVHQLVAEAFIGPRPDGMEVRHLDGDTTNNRPANLRYGTRAENAADMVRHGTQARGERCHKAKLTPETVREVRKAIDARLESQTAIGQRYGIDQTQVSAIKCGRTWAHVQ